MPLFTPGSRPARLTQRPATLAILGDTTLNPMLVGATQSAHAAVAALSERFIASAVAQQAPNVAAIQDREVLIAAATSLQAPATAAAALAERFSAVVTATQAPHVAAVQDREDFVAAETSTQAPHSALAQLLASDPVVIDLAGASIGGGGFRSLPRWATLPMAEAAVTATQGRHSCRGRLAARQASVAAAARQRGHTSVAQCDALGITQDEELLVAWLAAA
jgi:hypothetical protein